MIDSATFPDLEKRIADLVIRCNTLKQVMDNYSIKDHQRKILNSIVDENVQELRKYGTDYELEIETVRKIPVEKVKKCLKIYLIEIFDFIKYETPVSSTVFEIEKFLIGSPIPIRKSIYKQIGEKDLLAFIAKHQSDLNLLFPNITNAVESYLINVT